MIFRIGCLIGLFLLIAVPFVFTATYQVNIAITFLIGSIMALSLNVILGWGGLFSLCHASYLGIAAYSFAILTTTYAQGHFSAALAALAITVVVAGIFGVMALRATGLTFLMITLALGQIVWGLAYRWVSVTNGENGISGSGRNMFLGIDLAEQRSFYFLVLLAFVACFVCLQAFSRSPMGASLRGARDQPRRMTALGFNVGVIQWCAFVLSAFWAGVAGLLYFYHNQFINPYALSISSSAEALLMVIAGGAGTVVGPIVGSFIVVFIKDIVSNYISHWHAFLGFIFILIIVFLPEGIVPGLGRGFGRNRAANAVPK
ncbi:MAG: branched-chain amino acid ABC transporter permease [Rhizobiaceae bacterium]|nr:branched-chain amino acid ABC transporter permease [Rhizobiaceae bacterium]